MSFTAHRLPVYHFSFALSFRYWFSWCCTMLLDIRPYRMWYHPISCCFSINLVTDLSCKRVLGVCAGSYEHCKMPDDAASWKWRSLFMSCCNFSRSMYRFCICISCSGCVQHSICVLVSSCLLSQSGHSAGCMPSVSLCCRRPVGSHCSMNFMMRVWSFVEKDCIAAWCTSQSMS